MPRRFVFRKPVLFTLGLGLTTPYSLDILVWNIYKTFAIVCTDFQMRFQPQILPTRFAINFSFITARVRRKVRLCANQFDFFHRWILIRLTWNLSRFVPNLVENSYVEFQQKIILGEFLRNFVKTKAILYQKLWNFTLLFCNFILALYCVEKFRKKFTQVHSYVVCTQVRMYVHKQITKRRYREEKPGRFLFGKSVLFTLGLGLAMPYSLGNLVWNFNQTFVIVSIAFWQRFEPQIRPTRFAINFLFITARTERKVRLCAKLFDFFPRRIFIRLTWNLSCFFPNTVEFLTWSLRKKLFRETFSEILCKPRLSSTKTCEISPYFLRFYSGFVLRWKNSHEYPHMLFTTR